MNQKYKKPVPKAKLQKSPVKGTPKIHITGKQRLITRQQILILFILLIAIIVAYLPALNKEFINYDDDLYIFRNPNITNFRISDIPLIFGHYFQSQYSPVTVILYGILYMIAGTRPFIYNLFGIFSHLIITMLVFKFIWELNKNFRVAIFTAALFGLATIQVESVAWSAGIQKMGSYSIFFLSSLIVYIKYIKTNKNKFLIYSLLLFLLSCFSKEQAVALFLAVIVIDLYFKRKVLSGKVIIEKIPYFLLSAVFGMVTIAATKSNNEIFINSSITILDRIIYAGYALCMYLVKLIVPYKLSLFYPYPSLEHSKLLYLVFPLIILLLTVLCFWAVKKKRATVVLFGGLFFLVNMLFSLAIQVISVREVVMADRYVYIASIGIFFLIAKGADILIEKKLIKSTVITAVIGVYLLLTGFFTYSRTQVWKNSETIMTDAIEKFRFPLAYVNRGYFYRKSKPPQYDKALSDYTNAIAVKPDYALAYHNRGTVYFYTDRDSLAYLDYSKAIKLDPKYAETWSNRGAILAKQGHYDLALNDLNHAIELDPSKDVSYLNRALTYERLNRYKDAVADYDKYIQFVPGDAGIYNNRGVAKQHLEQFKESLDDFDKAISIEAQGNYYLSRSYSWNALGDKAKALSDVQTAVKLGSSVDPAYLNLLQK